MVHKKILFYLILTNIIFGCSENMQDLAYLEINTDGDIPWVQKKECVIRYSEYLGDTLNINSKVKFRGGISSKYPKHSFRVELDKDVSLAGLKSDDDWILNANYIDKTFMRHKLSYDLFRSMSPVNKAPHCAYVKLRENGRNLGLYVLMEKVDKSFCSIVKNDSQAMLFKGPPIFVKDELEFVQEPGNYYQQKYPKQKQTDNTQFMDSLKDFLFQASDQVFIDHVEEWFKISSVIDWHLLLLFTNNHDGILKNFYLFKPNAKEAFEFIPWDYDHSFGRDSDGEKSKTHLCDPQRAILVKRLVELSDSGTNYTQKLKNRYIELRDRGVFSEANFNSMVNENDEIIKDHIAANFDIWPLNSPNYFDDSSYQAELAIMREFTQRRLEKLDEKFSYKKVGN